MVNGWEGVQRKYMKTKGIPTSLALLSGLKPYSLWANLSLNTNNITQGRGSRVLPWPLWSLKIFSSQLSYSGANNLINTISFETSFHLFNCPVDMRNALIFFVSWYCWWFYKYLLFSQIFHLGCHAIFITFLHAKKYKLFWFLDFSNGI